MSCDVFISGISGFIGQALAKHFSDQGLAVAGLARSGGSVPGARVLTGDILARDSYEGEAANCRIAIHLAAPTTAVEINSKPQDAMKVNLLGTLNLMECFFSGKGDHFIYVSSGKVYGPAATLPFKEDQPLNPTTVLGKTKKMAEELLAFYAEYSGKRITIVRLFNAYGIGQRTGFLIPTIMEQIPSGRLELGDIRGRRDFIYIDDIVSAIDTMLKGGEELLPATSNGSLRICNLGSGKSHSPADIISILESLTGKKLTVVVDEKKLRSGEPDEERADISRLASIGWRPETDMKTGLDRTLRAGSDVAIR